MVDARARVDLVPDDAAPERREQQLEAVVRRDLEPLQQLVGVLRRLDLHVELARAHRLDERLLERAADRHRLADRLHVGRQLAVGARELLEREPRPLDHHVVDRRLEAGRRALGDVVVDLLERVADGQARGDLGDREAGGLGGERARLRDTRGFISMTMISSVCGLTANWMFDPPVSTPTARMTSIAWSRSAWYCLSVSVCCGATVTESPVCTPIGSMFSIEQTITTLSLRSRITSSSNSPQPITDSSISTCPIGDAARPSATRSRYSDSVRAMPPPSPPIVKPGRMIAGRPTSRQRALGLGHRVGDRRLAARAGRRPPSSG